MCWMCDPDWWGSDHHPIHPNLLPGRGNRLRRQCRVVDWDRYRSIAATIISSTLPDPCPSLRVALEAATGTTLVEESRPAPDLQLCRLWAARLQAELTSMRNPASIDAYLNLHRFPAAARRHERRLSRGRWLDWYASLAPSSSNASIWRTFQAIEHGHRPPDTAASALLASGQTPSAFASLAASTFFPAFHTPPAIFTIPNCLPESAG